MTCSSSVDVGIAAIRGSSGRSGVSDVPNRAGGIAFGGVLALGACAFFAKGLDSAAAYYVLESLGVLGNLSLFAFIIYGVVVAFADDQVHITAAQGTGGKTT